jgi:tRNA G18 (ribose-2'-O)-methylase SpoU
VGRLPGWARPHRWPLGAADDARLDAFAFTPSDLLLLGRESAGVPETVHSAADARVVIPLAAGARSLNVAMAGAIALAEAHRQTGWRLEMTAAPAVHVDT